MSWRNPNPRRNRSVIGAFMFPAVLLVALCGPAMASDYQPPTGFNGHAWGDRLDASPGLKLWRANVAVNPHGKMVDFNIVARPGGTWSIDQRVEGDGSFAVGEYYFNQDAAIRLRIRATHGERRKRRALCAAEWPPARSALSLGEARMHGHAHLQPEVGADVREGADGVPALSGARQRLRECLLTQVFAALHRDVSVVVHFV